MWASDMAMSSFDSSMRKMSSRYAMQFGYVGGCGRGEGDEVEEDEEEDDDDEDE